MIRVAGFNGTVVIIWVEDCLKRMLVRSSAGRLFDDMRPRSLITADRETCIVGRANAKPFFIGPMIVESFSCFFIED